MSGRCAVRGRRFTQPCRKNWPISPGPRCSSEPHSSLPGPLDLTLGARAERAKRAKRAKREDRNIERVQVIVPEGFDDPGQPTGGNIYDRRVCAGMAEAGW